MYFHFVDATKNIGLKKKKDSSNNLAAEGVLMKVKIFALEFFQARN